MNNEQHDSGAHAADLLALAGLLRTVSGLVGRLEANWTLRQRLFDGEQVRIPLEIPPNPDLDVKNDGFWLELRLVDASEVVEDALQRKFV